MNCLNRLSVALVLAALFAAAPGASHATMNQSIYATRSALAAIAMASVAHLACAQVPRLAAQGSTTYVTYYSTQLLSALDMSEVGSGTVLQFIGITRSSDAAKASDNMSVRCVAYNETLGGKAQVGGSCVEIDADGDKVFTTFAAGVHTIMGGSGKYKGISGSAPFSVVSRLPSPGAGLGALAVEHRVSWQIK
jgi:hypothetical protein